MVISIIVLYLVAFAVWRATLGPPIIETFREDEIKE